MTTLHILLLLVAVVPMLYAETCADTNNNCGYWASIRECSNNPDYMIPYCRKSCYKCPGCEDQSSNCVAWAAYCDSSPGYMHKLCKKTCNLC